MTGAPSVKDVARLAGVSTATVSRALNKNESVSPDTRKAVLEAAQEVGYRVNHSARSLRLRRTGAIAVLIPNVGNPFFSNILAGIESVMTQSNINVLILDTQGESTHTDIADYLTSQRADGIICLDGQLTSDVSSTESKMLDLPVVFGCEWPAAGNYSSVRADNSKGAKLAIDLLVSLGHKKIGHVTGPAENVLTKERHQATIESLRALEMRVEDQWFFSGDFGLASGARVAQQWLALDDRPTALFCASDLMAIGVMSELRQQGIKVPEEVSVIGFDDVDIARYYTPALTTIRQPTRELGATAAMALLDRLNGIESKVVLRQLDVELIERSSTAQPMIG